MKRKILLVLSIISIIIFVCACGGNNSVQTQQDKMFSFSGSSSGFYFGSALFEGSSSSAYDFSGAGSSFTITNATGFRIDSLIIRNSINDKEVGLLSEEKSFENWEEKTFFCPTVDKEEAELSEEDVEYSAEIELENGTKFLLHDFPLGKSVKMLVAYEKNIGYLIYENLENNKMNNTLDTETVLSKQELVDAGSDYGEINDPYNTYYQNPYADYDQPPVYVEPEIEDIQTQGGSKDGCLDGGLFW